jgi:hypothetical protein
MCKDATERRKKQTVAKRHEQMKKDLVFKVGGKPIEIVEAFKHLGRVTAKKDNNEEAVKRNLGRARDVGEHAAVSHSRWRKTKNDGGILQDSGVVCPALWKRVLGADEGFDASASKLPPTVLQRNRGRFYPTR